MVFTLNSSHGKAMRSKSFTISNRRQYRCSTPVDKLLSIEHELSRTMMRAMYLKVDLSFLIICTNFIRQGIFSISIWKLFISSSTVSLLSSSYHFFPSLRLNKINVFLIFFCCFSFLGLFFVSIIISTSSKFVLWFPTICTPFPIFPKP